MKRYSQFVAFLVVAGCVMACSHNKVSSEKTITVETLKDKIAGGWAGKMIGVTYGAPTEFRAQGKTYEDTIKWVPADVKGSVWQDDIYVQLTFLMAMERYGMDAPAKKFHEMFAKAGYKLWHANVQARKNYFDSIFPPQSGHPDYNLHADDIDFQIEADYIGFMCPGMPQTANQIADKIGHIMNYGDGVYGGVFVAALYSEAYFESDIRRIVEKALLSIPAESDYARIVRDVMLLHDQYPDNWRSAWTELEAKWGHVQICGAGTAFNIDAKLNGAYIVMGLLYGNGDPEKTLEISTRCGQDSDCNPSNAMAVLGVMKGYSAMPESWRQAVAAMSDTLFIHTDYSFNKAVDKTMEYAQKLVTENGGKLEDGVLTVKPQAEQAFPLEVSFPKLVFDRKVKVGEGDRWQMNGSWADFRNGRASYSSKAGDELLFNFEGTGVSLVGYWLRDGGKADIYVDGQLKRTIDCYFYFADQEHGSMDLYHITGLSEGKHQLRLVVKGEKRPESAACNVYISEAVVFKTGDKISDQFKFSFQK